MYNLLRTTCWGGLLCLLFSSCFKEDVAYTLPPEDTSLHHMQINIGDEYEHQVYISLEHNAIAHTSFNDSWDLALESGAGGYRVYMNGGQDVKMYKVGQYDFNEFTSESGVEWAMDFPGDQPQDNYVGDWRINAQKGTPDLFLVRLGKDRIIKLQLLSVDDQKYTLCYATLTDTIKHYLHVLKDDNYARLYIKVDENFMMQQLQPDPVSSAYEFVFKRYRHIYTELNNFPYLVNGAMLNPQGIVACMDTVTKFEDITADQIPHYSFSNHADIMGFDWKVYDFTQSKYTVRNNRTYLIRRQDGAVWKLRFTDFYDRNGMKGFPAFEYKRLQ